MILKRYSEFTKNVLTMLSGNAFAQVIPFAVMPFLTRIYSPEDFGLLALFMLTTTSLSVFATGRYELAIILPKKEDSALEVIGLTLKIVIAISGLIALILLITPPFKEALPSLWFIDKFSSLLPLGVLFLSLHQIYLYIVNREKRYKLLALGSILHQSIIALIRIIIGVWGGSFGTNGLILGLIGGHLFNIIFYTLSLDIFYFKEAFSISWQRCWQQAKHYKKFPLFTLPTSFVETISYDILVFILSTFNYLGVAGQFSLMKRVMQAPCMLLSSSLGQVFYKEAATSLYSKRLEGLSINLFKALICILTPLFSLIIVWGEEIFAFVFGEEWRVAGNYASYYAVPVLLFTMISWSHRVFDIANKQHITFNLVLSYNLVIAVILWVMLYLGMSDTLIVAIYSLLFSLFNILFLYFVFIVGKFNLNNFYNLLKIMAFILISLTLVCGVIKKIVFFSLFFNFGLSILLLLLCYLVLFKKISKNIKSS